jgi:hypothetical protein
MMNPVEREKQDQQRWQTRFSQGRVGLSASLEEALASSNAGDDEGEDCDEAGELSVGSDEAGLLLIRPRLSLQSKLLPIVRTPPQPSKPVDDSSPLPPESAQPAPKKKRLAGRNTRVELQAIPKPEKKAGKKTTPLAERSTAAQGASIDRVSPIKEVVTESSSAVKTIHGRIPAREKLSGRGVIRKGSAEAIVQNSHVTGASVVVASLLGNPGKVVVHYYTLLPGYGFTLHLSDEAAADTPFNFVILLGELF